MTQQQYVVLYKVREPSKTFYWSRLIIYQTPMYRELRLQGWRNAIVADKDRCNNFLEFVKEREGVIFLDQRPLSAPVQSDIYQLV